MTNKSYNPMEIREALKRGGQSDLRFACDFADQIVTAVYNAEDTETLSKGTRTYRARNKHDVSEENGEDGSCTVSFNPLPQEEMEAPPEDKVALGRFNPPNMPVLYLSTTKEVSLAEVRALPSDICTVATFELVKPVKVAKLLRHNEVSVVDVHDQNASPEILEKWLLSQIAAFVSRRVPDQERDLHYRSCNLIASAFKERGVEGLIYRTSFWSSGWRDEARSSDVDLVFASNVVLFDPKVAKQVEVDLLQINWKRPSAEHF